MKQYDHISNLPFGIQFCLYTVSIFLSLTGLYQVLLKLSHLALPADKW